MNELIDLIQKQTNNKFKACDIELFANLLISELKQDSQISTGIFLKSEIKDKVDYAIQNTLETMNKLSNMALANIECSPEKQLEKLLLNKLI